MIVISEYYEDKLRSLNVDRSSGHPKPHKVCLLLSVLQLIANGKITKNQFCINDELKTEFGSHFNRLKKGNDVEKIIQPFYHLHTDGIWHFKIKEGKQGDFDILKSKGGTPSSKSLFEVIDYAYLDEDLFNYFRNELTRDLVKQLLLENLEDLSEQYHRWLLSMGKSAKTAKNYVGAIKGSISNWAAESGISQANLISVQSYSRIHDIAEELAEYQVFKERNTIGNQMYSSALSSYQDFLSVACQAQVTEDIQQIINDVTIDNTEKATLVNTRVGQGRFREELIKYWKGCALTRYKTTEFLVASHIKPWRESNNEERLDRYNGLLLLPNLDKAFDLGYMSFSENGKIKISEFIEATDVLGIQNSMMINLAKQHQDYMAYHREVVFKE